VADAMRLAVGALYKRKFASVIKIPQPSRTRPSIVPLAEFGGREISFNICRGTLGSLASFTAMRNAYHSAGMKMNIARQGPDWRSS
jgi:hypothetical protein